MNKSQLNAISYAKHKVYYKKRLAAIKDAGLEKAYDAYQAQHSYDVSYYFCKKNNLPTY